MDDAGWDARYAATDLVWGGRPNRFVAEGFAQIPPGRALDLATGEGRNAIWLASQGWQVTAVDFSAVGIAKGRKIAEVRGVSIDWVVADLLEYRPSARSFAGILVAYLHLPAAERAGVLARAAEALAPGGTMLVVGHDATNPRDGVGGPQDPSVLYTPESIAAELTGLRATRTERVRRTVTTDDGQGQAIDTLVLATRD